MEECQLETAIHDEGDSLTEQFSYDHDYTVSVMSLLNCCHGDFSAIL
jgi:hypothetical protein